MPQHVKFSELTWTSGKASVELSTKEAGTIEYKVGKDGIYQAGTTISNLSNGDIVYARVNNSGTYTDEETLEIKDTIAPEEFTITTSDITYEGVKLTGSTQDNQTGIKDYTYVAASGDTIVKEIKKQTLTSYEITGLDEETEYVVYMLAYDNAGNVRKSNEETITTSKAPVANKFGEYIDYPIDLNGDGDTTNDWMIFYIADGNAEGEEAGGAYEKNIGDIYIIAADYLKNTDSRLKLSKLGANTPENDYLYSILWDSPTLQKKGTEVLTGTGRTINKLFMQNKFGALNNNKYKTKVTSTLLNTDNWEGYIDGNYADYAIGTPTAEMWVASWNAKCKEKIDIKVQTKAEGYSISGSTNLIDKCKEEKLYFPYKEKQNGCKGYWLASPSEVSNPGYMLGVSISFNGEIFVNHAASVETSAIRPTVHLKSGTQIQKVDGVWKIQ